VICYKQKCEVVSLNSAHPVYGLKRQQSAVVLCDTWKSERR